MEEILVAKGVKIRITNEVVEIDIYRNAEGNLELRGIGSVMSEWYDEELELIRCEW